MNPERRDVRDPLGRLPMRARGTSSAEDAIPDVACGATMVSRRRRLAAGAAAALLLAAGGRGARAGESVGAARDPRQRWYEAAERMRRLAQSWGDQPYGAVLVLDEALVGEGPSRVVKNADATAHAEREAIRDAQRRLGRAVLTGAILYSTSRPCAACESAAAAAGVGRMYFGASLQDAGVPRP